jgi:predicted SAM-dependent methyltransferase
MNYLNLGCGSRFHKDWVNLDKHPTNSQVQKYDVQNGIPFPNNTFNVVYHSHLLEHLTKENGRIFMYDCFRVLKPGGVLRVVVPDLEQI